MSENEITTEGNTVGDAVRKAAELLGVPTEQVAHKFDREHFRNNAGRTVPVDTVKLICWVTEPVDNSGALAAKAWLEGLIEKMGFQGTVTTRNVKDQRATISVDSESARFLVGRGGSTLAAISDMLKVAMEKEFGDWGFKIDVQGGRRDEERRDRGDRGDRGSRRERSPRRDRGDRRNSRGSRDERCSERDVQELKKLARRVAEAVVEGGEAEVIRKPLNSFERRIVHMEVADMDGLGTDTVEQDGERKIRIFIDNGEGASAEA